MYEDGWKVFLRKKGCIIQNSICRAHQPGEVGNLYFCSQSDFNEITLYFHLKTQSFPVNL